MKNRRSRCHWLAGVALLSVSIMFDALPFSEAFLSRPVAFTTLRQPSPSISPRDLTFLQAAKSGGKIVTSEEDFAEAALSASVPRPVMVFFTAPWCGPCRLSIPVVKEVIKEYSGQIEGVEVCTDDLPEIAADAGVVSIPTIQIYSRGEVQDTIVGCVAKKVLSMAVEKVLEDFCDSEEQPNGGGVASQ